MDRLLVHNMVETGTFRVSRHSSIITQESRRYSDMYRAATLKKGQSYQTVKIAARLGKQIIALQTLTSLDNCSVSIVRLYRQLRCILWQCVIRNHLNVRSKQQRLTAPQHMRLMQRGQMVDHMTVSWIAEINIF